MAGRRGRLPVDRRRARLAARRARRQDPTPACRVRTAGDIPPADVVLLDLAPGPIAQHPRRPSTAPGRPRLPPVPARARRVQARPRHRGRRALDEPGLRPGRHRPPRRHLRGDRRHRTATSPAGACRSGPFVLVGQQYLADPTRSAGDVNPLWTYAHVPHGYAGDATEAILGQIERFAPGFRDRIVASVARADDAAARLQPQLRRRRHHHRRQHRAPAACCGRGSRSTPTAPASPARSSARRPPRRAPAPTACAATTPPVPPSATSASTGRTAHLRCPRNPATLDGTAKNFYSRCCGRAVASHAVARCAS